MGNEAIRIINRSLGQTYRPVYSTENLEFAWRQTVALHAEATETRIRRLFDRACHA